MTVFSRLKATETAPTLAQLVERLDSARKAMSEAEARRAAAEVAAALAHEVLIGVARSREDSQRGLVMGGSTKAEVVAALELDRTAGTRDYEARTALTTAWQNVEAAAKRLADASQALARAMGDRGIRHARHGEKLLISSADGVDLVDLPSVEDID
jgi:hypothetical protein